MNDFQIIIYYKFSDLCPTPLFSDP